jgi:hypothetical protein
MCKETRYQDTIHNKNTLPTRKQDGPIKNTTVTSGAREGSPAPFADAAEKAREVERMLDTELPHAWCGVGKRCCSLFGYNVLGRDLDWVGGRRCLAR